MKSWIRSPSCFFAVALCPSFLFGCGDGDGSGGTGGSDATTTAATTANSTTSVKAASSTVTQGVTVAVANSSSTGMAGAADGESCTEDSQCAGGLCLTEEMTGIPGGQCTEECFQSMLCANATSVCTQVGQTQAFCLRECDPMMPNSCGMPATLECTPLSDGSHVCLGGCTMTAQCSGGRLCDAPTGTQCVAQEVCNNMMNDNINSTLDCEDGTCLADAGCVAKIAADCMGAVPLMMGANMGDTTMGTADLGGSCTGRSGAREVIYSFTPATTGEYTFHLSSLTDMGFYLRTTCGDPATEIACQDLAFPDMGTSPPDIQAIMLTMGTTYTVIVDGFDSPMQDGPFTLTVNPRGCNDLFCQGIPSEAPGGVSECTACAADCTEAPTCGFCIVNAQCEVQEACTCPECAADAFCMDPENCTNDGFCEQFEEGCHCADCTMVPNCMP